MVAPRVGEEGMQGGPPAGEQPERASASSPPLSATHMVPRLECVVSVQWKILRGSQQTRDRDGRADLGCASLFQFPTHLSLKQQVCPGPAADMTRRQSPDFLCKIRPLPPTHWQLLKRNLTL